MNKYTNRLSTHLASLPWPFWCSGVFVCLFCGTYVVCLLTRNFLQFHQAFPNAITALGAFASFLISWIGGRQQRRNDDRSRRSLQRRLSLQVPLAFSTALLFQVVGNCLLTYSVLHNTQLAASLITLLGTYLALLTGIFLLPHSTLSGNAPLRFVMDSLLLIAAIVTFSWYFLLGPILFQNRGFPIYIEIIGTSFAVFDLFIISSLILLSRSLADQHLRGIFRGLSFALIVFVLTDSFLVFQDAHIIILSIGWLCLGWQVGNFAIGLSLQAMRRYALQPSQTETAPPSSLAATPLWRSLLIYILVPAVFILSLSIWAEGRSDPLAIGTYCCCLFLLLIIFTKQVLVIREVHGLNQKLQRLQHALDEKNTILEQANARLETLATTDPLTELPNHRAIVATLNQELARSQHYQHTCSLLFFDLDHFKALNDTYGHAGGDLALCEFSSLLRKTLPPINIIGRLGGEEFLAVLPEKDAAEAVLLAEELRLCVANHAFTVGGGIRLTCSIGVAAFPAHAQNAKELLQCADSAMYGAKRLGRNQVRLIDDPAVVTLLTATSAVEGRDEITLIGTVHALALLVEKRDARAGSHAQRTGELLLLLSQSLGLSEAEAQILSLAGQLHDIGKIVIPDSILQKETPLTEQELACVRQHPQVGAEVVSSIPSLRAVAPIIRSHHEHWDGTGYPDQLAGTSIPFGARLLSVIDAYVHMTANNSHTPDQALAELQRHAGTRFDPTIVKQFLLFLSTRYSSREVVSLI